ncbi:MAG: integrase family protein [Polaromonas sp.]
MSKLQNRVRLTAGRVDAFTCPAGKSQAFLWDTEAPALALRVTPTGRKTYVFESRLNGATLRLNIGTAADWPIEKARGEAKRLKMMVDAGTDPREVERQQQADKAAQAAAAAARSVAAEREAVTVGEVWADYIEQRRPFWGELHYRDHIDKAKAGGLPSGRRGGGKQLTKPGPLASLMPLALRDLEQATVEAWAANEGKTRASSARLAWRLLTVFLTWCGEQPAYSGLLPAKNPAKTKKAREALGKPGTKSDVLQREQLAAWFAAVQQIPNPVIAACLQMMLLTGARPGEVLALRWEDVNTQWKGISIKDKVEGTREIPATPYMLHLLAALPRRNEWVFPSPTSASGCLTEPNNPHTRACKAAGLEGLTLHGLRRSFSSLTEWLETPAGVVAQIQGHKPSATAEKHYKVRPLELLRVHHEKIEAWIMKEAAVPLESKFKRKRRLSKLIPMHK